MALQNTLNMIEIPVQMARCEMEATEWANETKNKNKVYRSVK